MSTEFEPLLYYIDTHSSPEDEVLYELNRNTHLKVVNPRMLSGVVQGKFLEFISRMIQPQAILEIGTFTGYSAISLAKGLQTNGKLITIEKNDELENLAKTYFKKAGLDSKIELHIGDAIQILPALDLTFDLVYIDANKTQYLDYYKLIIDKLNTGGYILADNVLWGGKVLQASSEKDPETNAIQAFNQYIHDDKRVENIILSVRDGINLIRKI